MKEIGGHFELELSYGEEYHKSALRLNTGRNAFEYILRAKCYKKVFLPFYTCDSVLEPINKCGLEYEFYKIDNSFRPIFDFETMRAQEVFVYTNYFGIFDNNVLDATKRARNIIIDDAQAFYAKPLPGIDTFYSPRKFFGIPDGAYLYTNAGIHYELETDVSYERFEHLLGRIDKRGDEFYSAFKNNEKVLGNQPLKKMSNITQRMLSGIDYKFAAEKRKQNFRYLHEALHRSNQLQLELDNTSVPMVYPYLTENAEELKRKLINRKIYVATYWPNVIDWTKPESFEYHLVTNLIAVPIDQRYRVENMKEVINIINN